MALIQLNNITLTKGETSDVFEIFSKESLSSYQGHFRITDSARKELFKKALIPTPEIKNNDGIFSDQLFYELSGKTYDLIDGIREYNERDKPFKGKIKLTSIAKDELREVIRFEGIVTNGTEVKVVTPPTPPQSDESQTTNPTHDEGIDKTTGYKWYNTATGELFTWDGNQWDGDKGTTITDTGTTTNPVTTSPSIVQTDVVDDPAPNVEVTVNFISSEKEYSRQAKAVSDENGVFRGEIFLGDTTKQEKGFGFIFSIPATITEQLNSGRYVVTVVCEKYDNMSNRVFSKEVIQVKMDISEKM